MSTHVYQNINKYILGKTAIEELGPVMKANGVKRVLSVYGGGSVKKNGVYDRVVKTLKENNIDSVELWGVQANPVISKVYEGIKIIKEASEPIDTVLAIGGGSVIDTSKTIAAGATTEDDIYDCFLKRKAPPKDSLPIYVVLTISASASENDAGAVISNPETKEKLGTGFVRPPIACAVDPTVQFSLPFWQVMCGASDALSHLMEGMFSLRGESITSRYMNLAIQRSIYQAMEIIVKDPTNYAARENFCWAASLALRGETRPGDITFDGNVHGLEHCVSAFNDKISHGAGLAAIAPYYYRLIYTKPNCKESLDLWSKEVMGETDFYKGIEKFQNILKSWGAPAGLKSLGITEEKQVEEITKIFQRQYDLGRRSFVYDLKPEEAKDLYLECIKY